MSASARPGAHLSSGGGGSNDPVFTVVVPVFEQWRLVPLLLQALDAQAAAPSFDVVLVDNGTPGFAAPSDLPANVTAFVCKAPGSYNARNLGAAHAHGRWLAFTDADCVPDPGWLAALWAAAQRAPDSILVGAVRMVASSERPNASEIFDLVKGIPQERYARRGYGATANLALPRAAFERLGGFEAGRFSGGDAEFCRRAGRAGTPLVYIGEAVVAHPARTSWSEVATKARRIKGGQMRPTSAWRHRTLLGTLIPPLRGLQLFLSDPRHPLKHRLVAAAVLLRVWGVEVAEAIRLKRGKPRERR